MFTVKGVEKAVREMVRLLYLYDEEVDVEALVQEIDYENVTQYLMNRLEPIYSYKAKGDCEKSFAYLGKELLPQRGTLIYREFDRGASDIVVTSYERELWILEDMTLAVVTCFSVGVVGGDMTYSTEFRTYKGELDADNGFAIDVLELEELFQEMCIEQYEWEAPYHET